MLRTTLILRYILTGIACLLIAGCASFQPTPPPSQKTIPWETRKAALERIKNWDAKGSVSIQYKQKTDIASMNWHQENQHYNIALSGPLNFGSVEIVGAPGKVTFKQGNRPPVKAASPERLIAQQMGWQIPVSNLYYWLRGIPAPGSDAKTQFDNTGRITHMTQQGWTIEYAEYMGVGAVDLPKKIYLTHPDLKIRLVIRQWNL